MSYKMNDLVNYDTGFDTGRGIIVGLASGTKAVVGRLWIIKDLSCNFPNVVYEFDTFVCYANNIKIVE